MVHEPVWPRRAHAAVSGLGASGDLEGEQQRAADFGAGASFDGLINDYSRVTLGASVFHVTRPNETFKHGDAPMYMRYTAHGEATIGIKNTVYFFPAAIYQAQGPNTELIGGSAIG